MSENKITSSESSITSKYNDILPCATYVLPSDSEDDVVEVVYISSDDENNPPANFVDEAIPNGQEADNTDNPNNMPFENSIVTPNDGKSLNVQEKPEGSHVNAGSIETNAVVIEEGNHVHAVNSETSVVVIEDTDSESHYPPSSQSSNSLSKVSG